MWSAKKEIPITSTDGINLMLRKGDIVSVLRKFDKDPSIFVVSKELDDGTSVVFHMFEDTFREQFNSIASHVSREPSRDGKL